MKRIVILLLGISAYTHTAVEQRAMAPHTIMCFCKPAIHLEADSPHNIQTELPPGSEDMLSKLFEAQIDAFTRRGVLAAYHGYVTFADINGQLLFPRKHTSDDIFYIVTRSIRPTMSHGNTVQYFTVENAEHAKMYYLKRNHDAEQSITYWNVEELPIEDGQRIPPSGIIIFSRPEHIVVPTGTFKTIDGGNLLLPDLYIKKGIPIGPNVLAFLPLNKYFAPVTHTYTYTSDRYATATRP